MVFGRGVGSGKSKKSAFVVSHLENALSPFPSHVFVSSTLDIIPTNWFQLTSKLLTCSSIVSLRSSNWILRSPSYRAQNSMVVLPSIASFNPFHASLANSQVSTLLLTLPPPFLKIVGRAKSFPSSQSFCFLLLLIGRPA